MEEVTHIWTLAWRGHLTLNPNDPGRDGAARLSVLLAEHQDRQVATDVLGSIPFLGDSPEPAIVMYPNAIVTLVSGASLSNPVDNWPSARRNIIHGRVLGRALAHEIGHFLLRSRRHSAIGLMRAHQPVADLIGTRRQGFFLSADELMGSRPSRRRLSSGTGMHRLAPH
jgi:hypothetical protein